VYELLAGLCLCSGPQKLDTGLGEGRLGEKEVQNGKSQEIQCGIQSQSSLGTAAWRKGLLEASREYKIKDTVLSRWKQEFLERAPEMFRQGEGEGQHQEQERIAELERLVGRLTLDWTWQKKYSGTPVQAGKGNG